MSVEIARRTFFANHFGDKTFVSPVMFPDAHDDDIVIHASHLSFCAAPPMLRRAPPFTGRVSIGAFAPTLVPWRVSRSTITSRTVRAHARAAAGTHRGIHGCNQPRGVGAGFLSCVPTVPLRPNGSVRSFCPRVLAICRSESPFGVQSSRQRRRKAEHFVRSARCLRLARRSEYWRTTGTIRTRSLCI
jgi:hypothetical protein